MVCLLVVYVGGAGVALFASLPGNGHAGEMLYVTEGGNWGWWTMNQERAKAVRATGRRESAAGFALVWRGKVWARSKVQQKQAKRSGAGRCVS